MENKFVGFFGIDNSDIVLYLARILKNLKKKVLVIDLSKSGCIASAIPSDLDAKANIVDYKGIDFSQTLLKQDTYEGYDNILIHFGFTKDNIIKACSLVVFTTNQMKYNIDRLSEIGNIPNAHQQLLIKDYVVCKINRKYVSDYVKLLISNEEIYAFDLDTFDIKYRILSQFNAKITFRKITKAVRFYLLNTTMLIYPEKKEREIKKALNKSRRGK